MMPVRLKEGPKISVRSLLPLSLSLSRLSRLSLSPLCAYMQPAIENPVCGPLPPKKSTALRKQIAVPLVH